MPCFNLSLIIKIMTTLKKLSIAALLLAVSLLSGYLLGKRTARATEPECIVQVDTLRIRDTLLIERPVPVEVRVVDTMLVAVADTIRLSDTVYLRLPREIKQYEDSLFRAQVSGYRPELDWIEVYPQTVLVTEKMTNKDVKRWGIGLQAGYGAYVAAGQVRLAPYLGVGISYDIIWW